MSSIAQLPEAVISAIAENEEALWAWVSEQHYAEVIEQAGDHLLVLVKKRFSLARLAELCAGYHVYSGKQGQEPTYPIVALCWMLLLKYLNGWSLAKTAEEVQSNSLARWFCGFRLKQATPSYVTLFRFEQWVKEHEPYAFFVETLKQIDEDFPEEQTAIQIGDTFAMYSVARVQSRTELLRDSCQRLLGYLDQVVPTAYTQVMAALDGAALFGKADELPEAWLEVEVRRRLEERTAVAASGCRQLVQQALANITLAPSIECEALQRWLERVGKILKDEFTFESDQTGVVLKATLRPKHEKGSFSIGSTIDPEATFRYHHGHHDLGYNVSIAATTNFIREIAAATGAAADAAGVAPLIAVQRERLGSVPPYLLYDQAAGTPKIFADVAKASDGQTQLVARLIDYTKSRERFGPQDFTLEGGPNGTRELVCPNGVHTSRAYPAKDSAGFKFRFLASQCKGCPLWGKCREKDSKPTGHRNVFISDYQLQQRQAIAFTQSPAGKALLKLRPQVEHIIAALVRFNGARRAKSTGVDSADFQAKMTAVAYNFKRWRTLIIERLKPKQAQSPPADG
ncbi:MAG: transposase [Caldilineaceae bacterium]